MAAAVEVRVGWPLPGGVPGPAKGVAVDVPVLVGADEDVVAVVAVGTAELLGDRTVRIAVAGGHRTHRLLLPIHRA